MMIIIIFLIRINNIMEYEELQAAQKKADKVFLDGFGIKIKVKENVKLPPVNLNDTIARKKNSLVDIMEPLLEQLKKDVLNAQSTQEMELLDLKFREKIKPRIEELVENHSIFPNADGFSGNGRHSQGALISSVDRLILKKIETILNSRGVPLKTFSDLSSEKQQSRFDKPDLSSEEQQSRFDKPSEPSSTNMNRTDAIQTYLKANKNDAFYEKNIIPLFPKGQESKQNTMSKLEFEKFIADKSNVDGILKSGNKQMIVRVYQSVLENDLNRDMRSKAAQENFKAFESGVQGQIKSGALDTKYLPEIVKDRVISLNSKSPQ